MNRRLPRSFAFIVVTLALATGCSEPERTTEADCHALADHIVDVRMASAAGAGIGEHHRAELARHAELRKGAMRAELEAGCAGEMPKSYVTCALAADTGAQLDACNRELP